MGNAVVNGLGNKCLKNGIGMTSQRKIILDVTEVPEDHPNVDQIHWHAIEYNWTILIASVYRKVKLLEKAEVVDRLEFGNWRARYEESGDHHGHLVDVGKSEVIEFYYAKLEVVKEKFLRNMAMNLLMIV